MGALRLDAFLLLTRNRGRGGDGGCAWPSRAGSGVLGISSRRALRDQGAAKGWKGGMVEREQRELRSGVA